MWIFTGASERLSCCMSVLTATKSTWAMPASIIRLTALRPPPPTPTTRITARYEAASPPTLSRGAPSGIGWMKRLAGGSYGGSGRAAGTISGRAGRRRERSLARPEPAAQRRRRAPPRPGAQRRAPQEHRNRGRARPSPRARLPRAGSTAARSASHARPSPRAQLPPRRRCRRGRGRRRRAGGASRISVCWSSASAAGGNGSSTGSSP